MQVCAHNPVQSIIWHCLDHYDHQNAIFLAERLCAESETDETIYLLATSYYRAKQIPQAYWLLKKKCCKSPQCRFLQARCAYELKEFNAAEHILYQNNVTDELKNIDAISKEFADVACFVWQLMGHIYRKSERKVMARKAYQQALKLNPFLWQAFVELCNMGEDIDLNETFQINESNWRELSQMPRRYQVVKDNLTLEVENKASCFTPKNIINIACEHCSTPLADERGQNCASSQESGFALLTEQFSSLTSISPVTLSTFSEKPACERELETTVKSQPFKSAEIIHQPSGNTGASKLNVFTPAGNTPTRSLLERHYLKTNLSSTEMDSAKENKQSAALNKWSPRKPKYRFTKDTRLDESDEDNLLNAPPKPTENKIQSAITTATKKDFTQEMSDLRKQAADNFMELLCDFGIGYKLLASYQCEKAIAHYELNAPKNQLHTCGLQSLIAKCHYELQHYDEAASIFKGIHETEPCRFEYMDIYSSCLWQLQQPVELSLLAQDLVNCDRLSPVTWCVAGNCFSLQNDHSTAIRLMQRAVQVDTDFAYGYTLLGYEHIYHEDLDEARSCFELAVARDNRHYNAWFGIGSTYAKQQKHQKAEFYFRKALRINPSNSVILVHIAVMQHAQQHYQLALQTLNTASKLNPDNLIAKLQRARICFSLKRYHQALHQLEELKIMAPKEAIVFQLLGNVHQAMGHNDLALMYFSWSTDMDTKKAEPFTPVLPKRSL